MPASGRPDEITHWTGSGGSVFCRDKNLELAVLDQAYTELFTTGRVVKELERHRVAGDAPQKPQVLGRDRIRIARDDPQIDVTRVSWDPDVTLDGAAAFQRVANQLLAEPVERVTCHHRDHRTTRCENKKMA